MAIAPSRLAEGIPETGGQMAATLADALTFAAAEHEREVDVEQDGGARLRITWYTDIAAGRVPVREFLVLAAEATH